MNLIVACADQRTDVIVQILDFLPLKKVKQGMLWFFQSDIKVSSGCFEHILVIILVVAIFIIDFQPEMEGSYQGHCNLRFHWY